MPRKGRKITSTAANSQSYWHPQIEDALLVRTPPELPPPPNRQSTSSASPSPSNVQIEDSPLLVRTPPELPPPPNRRSISSASPSLSANAVLFCGDASSEDVGALERSNMDDEANDKGRDSMVSTPVKSILLSSLSASPPTSGSRCSGISVEETFFADAELSKQEIMTSLEIVWMSSTKVWRADACDENLSRGHQNEICSVCANIKKHWRRLLLKRPNSAIATKDPSDFCPLSFGAEDGGKEALLLKLKEVLSREDDSSSARLKAKALVCRTSYAGDPECNAVAMDNGRKVTLCQNRSTASMANEESCEGFVVFSYDKADLLCAVCKKAAKQSKREETRREAAAEGSMSISRSSPSVTSLSSKTNNRYLSSEELLSKVDELAAVCKRRTATVNRLKQRLDAILEEQSASHDFIEEDVDKIQNIFKSLKKKDFDLRTALSSVDQRTELLNKGGLFLPPAELLPFTTRARSLIKKLVNVTRFYDDVLIDASAAVNSDSELTNLWKTFYSKFNPSDQVHGPEICRALLSKLINAAFGVALKEVNARYTNLARNKKMKFTLREELKVLSSNLGGRGGGNTQALHPFNNVIAGRAHPRREAVLQQQGGVGEEVGAPRTGDYEALTELERMMFGEDLQQHHQAAAEDADEESFAADEDGEDGREDDEEEEEGRKGPSDDEWVEAGIEEAPIEKGFLLL
eukprot:gene27832-33613_t